MRFKDEERVVREVLRAVMCGVTRETQGLLEGRPGTYTSVAGVIREGLRECIKVGRLGVAGTGRDDVLEEWCSVEFERSKQRRRL